MKRMICLYHIVAINNRTGDKTYMTGYADTHAHCYTIMRKLTVHKTRRIQLEEA